MTKLIKKVFNTILFPEPSKPPFYHICQVGDPVLRMRSLEVSKEEINSPHIRNIISQLIFVMQRYKSEGLSAPQLGIPLRIFVMESTSLSKKKIKPEIYAAQEMSEFPLTVFINPIMKVLNYDKVTFSEGCESICGFSGDVARYKSVHIAGLTPLGEKISQDFHGWLARIAQHEMDHLQGKLYVDNMNLSTFKNDAWHKINVYSGRVQLRFDGKVSKLKS